MNVLKRKLDVNIVVVMIWLKK